MKRVVDRTGDLRDALGGVDGRRFGQGADEFDEAALQVFPEGRQPFLVREHRDDRHPVVVRKCVRHIGLEEPGVTDPAVQRKIAEVREIAQPCVLVPPGRRPANFATIESLPSAPTTRGFYDGIRHGHRPPRLGDRSGSNSSMLAHWASESTTHIYELR
ncbi:hypothetical protein [Streptomyces sp. NPDC054786]